MFSTKKFTINQRVNTSLLERRWEASVVTCTWQAGLKLWGENSALHGDPRTRVPMVGRSLRATHSQPSILHGFGGRGRESSALRRGEGTENCPKANLGFAKPLILTVHEGNCNARPGLAELLSACKRCAPLGTTRLPYHFVP